MEWATNAAGDQVRAGTPDAYGYAPLRCPVCKAAVYHRSGTYNRPHFAHYSGNSNRKCELYDPRKGSQGGTSSPQPRHLVQSGFGAPALIWVDEELASLSLRLRLPKFPKGYTSKLTITSSNGTRTLVGEELTRTALIPIPLREPPATVKTTPPDPATEMRVEDVLRQFRLSENYFRMVTNGGVLENLDAALELGEEYFYVSQRPLPEPFPSALKIAKRKEHWGWWVYQVALQDSPDTRRGDIADLKSYFGKSIVAPKPRIEVVWPPASRFDADGTAIFAKTTRQLIARSNGGPPNVEAGSGAKVAIEDLGKEHYQITFNPQEEDAIVWMPEGAIRRIRFADEPLATPRGVMLTTATGGADLASVTAAEIASQYAAIEVSVPSERLWRNARVNGRRLSPLPDGKSLRLKGPLQGIRFGAFGSVAISKQVISGELPLPPWYSNISLIVATSVGRAASEGLKFIHSKHQAVRWAAENDAMHLLPLVLSALSAGVSRGVS